MPIVRLKALSVAEAEEGVARVWQVLEAHHIATPQLKATESEIVIELTFASPEHAELVVEILRDANICECRVVETGVMHGRC